MRACTPAKTNRNSGDDEADIGRRIGKIVEDSQDVDGAYSSPQRVQDGRISDVEVEVGGENRMLKNEKDCMYSGPSSQFACRYVIFEIIVEEEHDYLISFYSMVC